MPTSKPRHTITETGSVGRVLESLRGVGESMTTREIAELIVVGGEARLDEIGRARADEERRRERREGFLALSTDEIDTVALEAVHDHGWSR